MFAAAYLQLGRGAGQLGDVSAHHAGLLLLARGHELGWLLL